MESQTSVFSVLAEYISMTSLRHQYDVIFYMYDVIGTGTWQTVYAVLHQIFIDITN